jgi:HTH-type transcriptional regulator / antitoxin HigA
MNLMTQELQEHWTPLQRLLSIRNEKEYDQAVEKLNLLIDEVGTDEKHPLYELLDTVGIVIQAYEDRHYPVPSCSGSDALRFLMAEHDLKQSDLQEVGSQGVVSEILNGRRDLNVRQIRALAKRFRVSPAVFL